MAAVTITASTKSFYVSVEGTIAQVLQHLEDFKIAEEDIVNLGYSGISGKIFFAVYRKVRST